MNKFLMQNRCRWACLVALLVLFFAPPAVCAQEAQPRDPQKSAIADFLNSVAQATYTLAWPTATYKKCEIVDFKSVVSGYDVIVKLSGISAFDDSDLWLKILFAFRDGRLNNIRLVDHNGLWPPFKTIGIWREVIANLLKQWAESVNKQNPTSVARVEAGAICLINSTNAPLVFTYRWGSASWKEGKLEIGIARVYWWRYEQIGEPTSPPFQIRYDDSFDEGYTEQAYVLLRYALQLPVTCDAAKKYEFTRSGNKISLNTIN